MKVNTKIILTVVGMLVAMLFTSAFILTSCNEPKEFDMPLPFGEIKEVHYKDMYKIEQRVSAFEGTFYLETVVMYNERGEFDKYDYIWAEYEHRIYGDKEKIESFMCDEREMAEKVMEDMIKLRVDVSRLNHKANNCN